MRLLALAALLLVATACSGGTPATLPTSTPTPTPTGVTCGSERWAVKTLSDQDAAAVNLSPTPSSVAALRALPKPSSLPPAARIDPTELTTFAVPVQLLEFKLETDRDIHLVVADPADASNTMIVEFPDVACAGAVSSSQTTAMRAARAALLAAEGPPPSSQFKKLTGHAVITGVGFFDFQHGQTGVAPNAIELHPVLNFTVTP